MTTRTILREAVTLVALVAALSTLVLFERRNATLRETVLRTRLSSRRAQAQDRLVGRVIDVAALGVVQPGGKPSQGRPSVLWVVDLENCAGCFDSVGEWTRLERLVDRDLFLLLIGSRAPDVVARLRALRRTVIVEGTRRRVVGTLGPILPNTKMLLDSENIAVLVDSRSSGQECGWSFEAQVAAIAGVTSGRAIRLAGP